MWSASDKFIEHMNKGLATYRALFERETPDVEKTPDFQWDQRVDYVVVGGCSEGMPGDPIPTIIEVIKVHEIEDDTVIMILSDCCYQYDDEQQTRIHEAYPQLTFLFPHQPDFCDAFSLTGHSGQHSHLLAMRLKRQGIIKSAVD